MANIPNGVKTDTIENIEFEAGLILKKKFTTFAPFKDLQTTKPQTILQRISTFMQYTTLFVN